MLNQATGALPRPPGNSEISGYCPMLAQASYPYPGPTYAVGDHLPQATPTNSLHQQLTTPQARLPALHVPQLRPQDQNILAQSNNHLAIQLLAHHRATSLPCLDLALVALMHLQGQQRQSITHQQATAPLPPPPPAQMAPVATQPLQQPISYHQQAPPPSHIQQQTLQTIQQNQLQLAPAPHQLVPSLHQQAPAPPPSQHQRHVPSSLSQTQQQPQAPTQTQPQLPQQITFLDSLDPTFLTTILSLAIATNRQEAHGNHHHHPSHPFHNMHGTHHHHHHHHHAPNSQNNVQDEAMLTMSESKPRGLSRSEIDSLTHYIHQNEKDTSTCVICLSKFEPKSKIRPLSCHHTFHAKCVDKWLRANRTCPICRRDALKSYSGKLKKI